MSIDLQNLNEQVRELQPPSARDRLIFEAVVVKGRGQGEVAAEHGVSQPRVSQIVAEVGAWLDRALPQARQNKSTSEEMAVGMYVFEAQIDFLLQQTLHDLAESRKDKVTEKAGTRGVVNWTETKTEGRQIAKVGLINAALRLAQAKAKLAGVDVTGRTQREAAIAEERQRREAMARRQEAGVRGQESEAGGRTERAEWQTKKGLIKKNEKRKVVVETLQLQVEAANEDKLRGEKEEFIKNTACKQLINHLREDPRYAGWTDKQFQEYAQFVWDSSPPEGDATVAAELASSQRAIPDSAAPSRRDILPVSGGTTQRQCESRRRDERQSSQERRRKFLAPLAAG
jgi:hypothetical protein